VRGLGVLVIRPAVRSLPREPPLVGLGGGRLSLTANLSYEPPSPRDARPVHLGPSPSVHRPTHLTRPLAGAGSQAGVWCVVLNHCCCFYVYQRRKDELLCVVGCARCAGCVCCALCVWIVACCAVGGGRNVGGGAPSRSLKRLKEGECVMYGLWREERRSGRRVTIDGRPVGDRPRRVRR